MMRKHQKRGIPERDPQPRPKGCICRGPYIRRDPEVWTWGDKHGWYEAVKECPHHKSIVKE